MRREREIHYLLPLQQAASNLLKKVVKKDLKKLQLIRIQNNVYKVIIQEALRRNKNNHIQRKKTE